MTGENGSPHKETASLAMHVASGGTLAHFAPGWQSFCNPPTYLFLEYRSREPFSLSDGLALSRTMQQGRVSFLWLPVAPKHEAEQDADEPLFPRSGAHRSWCCFSSSRHDCPS